MRYQTVLVEIKDKVAKVILNRPEKKNAMNPQLVMDMTQVLEDLRYDDDVAVLILTGAGDAFCAGMDLKEFFYDLKGKKPNEYDRIFRLLQEWRGRTLRFYPKPTIAMVNGFCFGGAFPNVECCDLAIAADEAQFGLSEINFGLFPGGHVSKTLANLFRPRDALFYGMTGRRFDGKKAAEIGFVNYSVPLAQLEAETMTVAKEIAGKDPAALRATKDAYRHLARHGLGGGDELQRRQGERTLSRAEGRLGRERHRRLHEGPLQARAIRPRDRQEISAIATRSQQVLRKSAMKVLDGIRVLDLGGFITGPFAALLLAELGADVIKVEWPGKGDKFRAAGGGLYSSQFQAHNRDKRSITLDYAKPAGREVLQALVRASDVLIINSRPGVMEKLGVSYNDLKAVNPRLIYCAITGFGADGPYADRPAFDNVGQALSGWMSRHRRGDDPRVAGPAIADPVTSYYAAIGVLGALVERARTGQGRLIEVNLLESMIGLAIEPITSYFTLRQPIPVFERAATSQAYNLTCRDGKRIGLHASMLDKFFHGLCRAIEREDWIEKYPTRQHRIENYEALAAELSAIFRTRDRVEWVARLENAVVPFGVENELQDLEDDPQIKHLDVFYEIEHPQVRQGQGAAPAGTH